MKHNLIILHITFLSLYFLNCKQQLANEPETNLTQKIDTLFRNPAPGVTSSLEFVKDSYNLDDTVYCRLVLRNEPSTSPFIIDASYPAYLFRVIYLKTGDIVTFAPFFSYDTEEHDTLRAGDSLTFDIKWNQNVYIPTRGSSGLKTFSGEYLLEAKFIGNNLLLPMDKYFEVTDVGSPLSADLEVDDASTDSVNAMMTVRNRLSTSIGCTTSSSAPIQVAFVNGSDTVLAEQYPLVANDIIFPAHTDSLLFYYKKPKSDPRFINFKGGYKIVVTLNVQVGRLELLDYNILLNH